MLAQVLLNYREFLFSIKNRNRSHSLAGNRWEYINSSLKKNAITFSENSNTQENIRISRLKKRILNIKRLPKKINQKLNQ